VKLLRIGIENFGPIGAVDSGEDRELPTLVVVLGPNEAGKSTFHQAVTTLLYGFYPASRDRHPFAPWNGTTPELTARIGLEGQRTFTVHRRLLSRPDGSLTEGTRVEDLRNRALPQLAHVPLDIYRQVYAITLADLAGLSGEGWKAVEDRLVVGMGSTDLRSPREVAEELERAAAGLWRADRRGSPEHAGLRKELGELREARRKALDSDRELRETHRRAAELASELEKLEENRDREEASLARIRRLRPLNRDLAEIDRLRRVAGPPDELAALPADPEAALLRLDERISELADRVAELERSKAELLASAAALTDDEAGVLADADRLRALADAAPLMNERTVRRAEVEAELRHLRDDLIQSASPLVDLPGVESGPAVEELPNLDPAPFAALSPAALREVISELDRALDEHRDARRRVEELTGARSDSPEAYPVRSPWALPALTLGGALIAAGALLLVLDRLTPAAALVLLVAGAAGVAAAAWITAGERAERSARRREREARNTALSEAERRRDAAARQVERARELVRERIEHLPLRSDVVEALEPALLRELERLRDRVLGYARRAEALQSLRERDDELARELSVVRERYESLADLAPDPAAALPELGRRLEGLARRHESAARARGQLEPLADELERLLERSETLAGERRALLDGIMRVGGMPRVPSPEPEAVQQALTRIAERTRAARALDEMAARLRREVPELEAVRRELERARGEPWLEDPDAEQGASSRLRELDEEAQALSEELGGARERIASIEKGVTADMIDGRIEAIEVRMHEVARERDRLIALARIVRTAERRFRDEHQPDLVRRAGEYLGEITAGRYTRLLLQDDPGGAPIALEADHLPGPLAPEPPLSTGTLEQVYLALRLAIVDHLDREQETLPLFLDEVLVNWDPERRERGLSLLSRIARSRQVFLFTCHPELAAAAQEQGAAVLELQGPEGAE